MMLYSAVVMLTALDIDRLRQIFQFFFIVRCIYIHFLLNDIITTTQFTAASKTLLCVSVKIFNLYYAGHQRRSWLILLVELKVIF